MRNQPLVNIVAYDVKAHKGITSQAITNHNIAPV